MLSIVGGNVLIQKPGSSNWRAEKEGTTLQAGDKIKTDTAATAIVTFFDGSTIALNGGTEIYQAIGERIGERKLVMFVAYAIKIELPVLTGCRDKLNIILILIYYRCTHRITVKSCVNLKDGVWR